MDSGRQRERDRRQAKRWRRGRDGERRTETETQAPKEGEALGSFPSSRPISPDFPDILVSHLHVDDDGVDLVLDQLPHAPSTQLQQAVLLLRGSRLHFTLRPETLGSLPPDWAP